VSHPRRLQCSRNLLLEMCVTSYVRSTLEQFQSDQNMALSLLAQTLPLGIDNLLSHFLLGINLTVILLTASACSSICKFDTAKKMDWIQHCICIKLHFKLEKNAT
jgi:CBS domain containing-hemolysin-like protein